MDHRIMSAVVIMKRCTACGEEKPGSEFYRNGSRGLHGSCKECHKRQVREYQAAERERMGEEAWRTHQAEIVRRSRAKHPGVNRLQVAAYNAAAAEVRERHRAEFDAIYADEKRKRGLA
jgi:hypothetical protein